MYRLPRNEGIEATLGITAKAFWSASGTGGGIVKREDTMFAFTQGDGNEVGPMGSGCWEWVTEGRTMKLENRENAKRPRM